MTGVRLRPHSRRAEVTDPDAEVSADFQADWRMLVINAKPPSNPRAGALVPIEGGRWMVALIGAGRDYPPTDDAGFLPGPGR